MSSDMTLEEFWAMRKANGYVPPDPRAIKTITNLLCVASLGFTELDTGFTFEELLTEARAMDPDLTEDEARRAMDPLSRVSVYLKQRGDRFYID